MGWRYSGCKEYFRKAMTTPQNTFGRKMGTAAVEQRLTAIALLMHEVFPHYSWEVHEETNQPTIPRLHVYGHESDQYVDFSWRELITYSNVKRSCTIDHRMHDTLRKLFVT